jgi:hypothetical protein
MTFDYQRPDPIDPGATTMRKNFFLSSLISSFSKSTSWPLVDAEVPSELYLEMCSCCQLKSPLGLENRREHEIPDWQSQVCIRAPYRAGNELNIGIIVAVETHDDGIVTMRFDGQNSSSRILVGEKHRGKPTLAPPSMIGPGSWANATSQSRSSNACRNAIQSLVPVASREETQCPGASRWLTGD